MWRGCFSCWQSCFYDCVVGGEIGCGENEGAATRKRGVVTTRNAEVTDSKLMATGNAPAARKRGQTVTERKAF